MNTSSPIAGDFFERLYQQHDDPWHFRSSQYEQERYRTILSMLRRPYYGSAFEAGCSIGELTRLLAPRCADLLAIDVSATALNRAAERCAPFGHVRLLEADLAMIELERPMGLIVLSEIGYYFAADVLAGIARKMAGTLAPDGDLVACHWLGHSPDHVLHGDAVHEIFSRTLPLRIHASSRHEQYRVELWTH
jgi:SAM-dependent methyltransferase